MTRFIAPIATLLLALILDGTAWAYTAAGDREFPATILLPQIGPADELYVTGQSQPVAGGRVSGLYTTFDKTITERFGLGVTAGYGFVQTTGAPTQAGWQNTSLFAQYAVVIDPDNEFLLSLGGERELGGTGARRAGADPNGATTPLVYFGQGLGNVGADFLKPVSIVGNLGATIGDGSRPNQWTGGLALEYSIPYYTAKVGSVPDAFRDLVPMVEFTASTPMSSRTQGTNTELVMGPGVNITGAGWELGVEATVPLTRAAGRGLGMALQLHIALDYLLPDSLGMPLIQGR